MDEKSKAQQHSSLPDSRTDIGENTGKDKIHNQNLELQESIQKLTVQLAIKNRELEIEAALEKVRSRSLEMHDTAELQDVIQTVHQELLNLKIAISGGSFIAINSEIQKEIHCWGSGGTANTSVEVHIPLYKKPFYTNLIKGIKNGPGFFSEEYTQKEKRDFFTFLFKHEPWSLLDSQKKKDTLTSPGGYTRSCYVSPYTSIFIINHFGEKFSEADNHILKRFGKVFEQSYTRFLDLKKAESQAREAQINLAVERVRARALSMYRSEEILLVVNKLKEEIMGLDIPNVAAATIYLREPDGRCRIWDLTSVQLNDEGLHLPLDIRFRLEDCNPGFFMRRVWENTADYFVVVQGEDDFKHTLQWLRDNDLFKQAEETEEFFKTTQIKKVYHPTVPLNNGRMSIDLLDTPATEVESILKKMAGAFDLAYKRFEDLQKAEAQTQEAQIESALERVRSRTMGMRHSDELPDVANMLFLEVQALGIPAWSSGFNILAEDHKSASAWMSSEGILQEPFTLRLCGEASFDEMGDFLQSKETMLVQELGDEGLEEHYEFMKSFPDLKATFENIEEKGLSLPTYQINHLCKFSHGFLLFITYEPVPDAHDIFKRFTKVFDQTYTRFLDLQKAETQARESQTELSLERIRARVTAMQESTDLFDIVVGMRSEFISLGHEADYFWHMRWLPEVYEMSMTSEDGHRLGMVINVPKFVHDQIPALAAWEKGKDPVFVLALNADDAWDYIENMNTHGQYEQADPHAPTRDDIQNIGGLTFIIARTTHGEIGYSLPGVVPKPSQEALDTLVRFAGVFDLAYKRFEDLKTAEKDLIEIKAAREKAEKALIKLKATQDQLIQQEKLASLGQLTAGIAHEIKNPLNFVNNFSEVSIELIEEVLDELKEIGENEHTAEAKVILSDIESNLRKIHEHGSRADSIVKSMLEHSRGGSGKTEPTDLNTLVKEFVTLSFHGMRAGKNPINVGLDFDLDESILHVPLIAEDFSRVIINLCNNAFDAMRETEALRAPSLAVRTRIMDRQISIEIEDNGPGISDEIKDKILQPFFTTKKGTQGTGLGLSITNDIIKAHGGDLNIASQLGKGTTFSIELPKMK